MKFKAKLRRVGNSMGVITPKEVITAYKEGDVITLEVVEGTEDKQQVITDKVKFPTGKLMFNIKKGIYERN